jgi:membrane fusion protein (multidrug efflux system)
MTLGQEASVEADAYPGRVFHGKIHSFSAATGAKFSLLPPDNATGNFVKVTQRVPVKILLDTRAMADRLLVPGMNVKVSIRKK